jgi:hypothetical protein
LTLLPDEDPAHVVGVTYRRKLRTIVELVEFLVERDIESTQDLTAGNAAATCIG